MDRDAEEWLTTIGTVVIVAFLLWGVYWWVSNRP